MWKLYASVRLNAQHPDPMVGFEKTEQPLVAVAVATTTVVDHQVDEDYSRGATDALPWDVTKALTLLSEEIRAIEAVILTRVTESRLENHVNRTENDCVLPGAVNFWMMVAPRDDEALADKANYLELLTLAVTGLALLAQMHDTLVFRLKYQGFLDSRRCEAALGC